MNLIWFGNVNISRLYQWRERSKFPRSNEFFLPSLRVEGGGEGRHPVEWTQSWRRMMRQILQSMNLGGGTGAGGVGADGAGADGAGADGAGADGAGADGAGADGAGADGAGADGVENLADEEVSKFTRK
jgi:hypothetical protein